ncbi:MinD-like ATPase involved in chromosome partitioning or flagellar assembly [Microbacterium trichothecenolyticum]|uniref:MinD/ParA family ATP-binding protein n=1 Tax=Microbacterium trichothecenolyticum TaxID=69370 RepID=UPI00285CD3B7|nr:AAA family ATPase [Microbacterium trichothecenolyticum]MDR7110914.1 MinD-like ATPase involved in chromosome partitioning or flagellar assembly [Microbacterium trichothecenolyticum]
MTTVAHPRTYATVTGPTATFIATDGHTEPVTATGDEDIRHAVIRRASDEARRTGTPVELVTSGDRGRHHLLVDPAGDLTRLPTTNNADPNSADDGGLDLGPYLDVHDATVPSRGEEVRQRAPQAAEQRADGASAAEAPARPTFLTPTADTTPGATGWRGVVAALDITVRPSAAEVRRAAQQALVARQWAGCRTIAVVNGKGGVGKTMTTAMLAAVYAREGGGNVLAWDNNDTRGTLGWRTEQGLYDTTLRDLLPSAEGLLAPGAGVSEISRFVHHQNADRYDVLRSNPELLATDQRINAAELDVLMQVAARFYRMVIFDSGNDKSAQRWLRMIDSSYQLVIPTLTTAESAESAALLLDALRGRDERSAALADRAVVLVSQSEPTGTAAARRIADGFAGHVRAVHIIPFDPALKAGPLRFDTLRPRTRDAWLAAAASAAEGL